MALDTALGVLRDGTSTGSFLAIGTRLNMDFKSIQAEAKALEYAADLGEEYLSPTNAHFLRLIIAPENTTLDWKKLNTKSPFKVKYEARSKEIMKSLAELLATFKSNLHEAQKKEEAAVASHEALMAAKKEEKRHLEELLVKLKKENGARALTRSESQDEIDSLKLLIKSNDDTTKKLFEELGTKTNECFQRKTVRMKELEAITQGISILHNDDARDLFARSEKSRGYSFFQMDGIHAQRALPQNGGKVKNLIALAQRVAESGGPFDEVRKAISSMIGILRKEEDSDLRSKDDCEAQRMQLTRVVAMKSRDMDTLSQKMGSARSQNALSAQQISLKQTTIEENRKELKAAQDVRDAEKSQWLKTNKDNIDAAATIRKAKDVLAGFYEAHAEEKMYAGKQEESIGIISILSMLATDLDKDIAAAKSAEEAAEKNFNELKKMLENQVSMLLTAIAEIEGVMSDSTKALAEDEVNYQVYNGELKQAMDSIEKIQPGCAFITLNFQIRQRNRKLEIDGLNNADGILARLSEPA